MLLTLEKNHYNNFLQCKLPILRGTVNHSYAKLNNSNKHHIRVTSLKWQNTHGVTCYV